MSSLAKISSEIGKKDVIVDVIPLGECVHPAATETCLVLIKVVDSDTFYSFHLNSYDVVDRYEKNDIEQFLNKLRGRIFCFSKRTVLHQLKVDNLLDLSLICFIESGDIFEQDVYDTASHLFFRNKYQNHLELNKIIPSNNHISRFLDMCEDAKIHIKKKYEESYYEVNTSIIETLQSIESHGLQIDFDEFIKHFPDKKH